MPTIANATQHPSEYSVKSLSDFMGHPIDSGTDWDAIHEGLNNAKNAKECAAIATQYGFNFTEQQFQDYFEENLTPEQLEAVGGGDCCCSCCSSC
jgi:hypothetical protein